jgi:flagellin-like hook-associated protein FlgL
MMTGVPLSVSGYNIAQFTKRNTNYLGQTLVNLASGKRVNKPSDNIPDFFHSDRMKRESRSQQMILRRIGEGKALVDVATSVSEIIFTGITDMKDLVKRYYRSTTDTDERAALGAEFESLKNSITATIGSSYYNGQQIVSDNGGTPFMSIALEDEASAQKIDISYTASDIANVSSLTLGTTDEATEMAAVEAELGKAGSYMAKSSAYMRGLNAHYNLVNNKITIYNDSAEESVKSDTGEELLRAMNASIQNETATAMLAQANMFRGSVVRLLGW